ncbi:15667_t:CDS:2 [Funneliformis geosporum]|nr:15667_t:CDS:2 [Funneliformis geosporum]
MFNIEKALKDVLNGFKDLEQSSMDLDNLRELLAGRKLTEILT